MTDDQLIAALLRHLDAGGELPAMDFPYDDLLAGLASGTLLDDERAKALQLLDREPAFRELLAEICETDGEAQPSTTSAPNEPLRRWFPLGVAAALILGVGAAVFFLTREPRPATLEAQLVAYVDTLTQSHPKLFEGFSPATSKDRLAPYDRVRRGAPTLIAPHGALISGRPTFRWKAVHGATSYVVTVVSETGDTLIKESCESTELAWPEHESELPPGKYVWKLVAKTPARRATAAMAIHRLSQDESRRYREGLAAINVRGGPLASLTASQWAAHWERWSEAHQLLQDAPDNHALVRETRAWIRSYLKPK